MKKHDTVITHVAEGVTEGVDMVTHAAAKVVSATDKVLYAQAQHNRRVWERHPFLFGILGTFGIVAVGTGFQDLVHTLPLLRDRPIILVLVGVVVLFFTGALYKRLQQG